MSEQNVEVVKKIMTMFESGNFDGLESLMAENAVDHQTMPGIEATGREGFKAMVTAMRTAFPDIHSHVDDIIDAGDKVVIRSTMHGTNTGEMMGMPPTGKSITAQSIDIIRFENGMAVEHWGITEELQMMQQLGLIPSDH